MIEEFRFIIFVSWNHVKQANSIVKTMDRQVVDTGDQTFGIRLSADGLEPPTHSVCNTAADAAYRDLIIGRISTKNFVDVYDAATWTYNAALIDMGLMRIEPKDMIKARDEN